MSVKNTRDSYIFYRSFYEAIKELPSDNQLEIYNAIAEYSLNFKEVELSGLSKTIFTLIKPQLEANNKKYINGTKPKQKQKISKTEAKNKQDESKTEGNVNDNVNVECIMNNENVLNVKKGDQKPKKPQFTKPTLEEIKEYNNSRGGCVDAKKFYDYYEAGNWKDQKGNKIKNWKQKLITWENKVNKNNTESNREQHTADLINKMCNDTLIKKISLKSDKILNFHTTKENKEKLQNLPENQKQEIKSILKDNFGEKTIEFIY